MAKSSKAARCPRLKTLPGKATPLTIPFAVPELFPGAEAFLTLRFALKDDSLWAEAGHEVGWEQFKLPYTCPGRPTWNSSGDLPALKVDEIPETVPLTEMASPWSSRNPPEKLTNSSTRVPN